MSERAPEFWRGSRARRRREIVATDIDPVALDSAKKHASLDPYPARIQVTDASPDHLGPKFDLVVANILEGPLRELAPSLGAALAPGSLC